MRRRTGGASHRRWSSCLAAVALVSVAAAGRAEDKTGPAAPPTAAATPEGLQPATGAGDDGRRTMGRLPANLGRTAIGVFSKDNLVPVLVGGAATGISSIWDDNVHNAVVGDQFNWSSTVSTTGGPVYSTIFVAGMFTAGRFAHSSRFRAMTYDMLDASIVNFAYTEVLKLAVGRERPNRSDNKSFPSGHTSNAFTLATVAEQHYGWKLGVPAYLVAGLVGASRLGEDAHWLSDVFAGATLGYIVGRTVVRVNGRPLDPGHHATLNVSPIVSRRARGLQVAVVF
jgi:membrane-associated phospholipid phosphatase